MSPIRVAVLAFDGMSLFHLSVPGMVLGTLNGDGRTRYDVRYCAPVPGLIRSDQGLAVDVPDGLHATRKADIIIVPAWNDPQHAVPAALSDALRRADAKGKLIVGLCLGAFVLGEAGLLEDREATTHWSARDEFARRFPNTKFRPDVLYVADGNVITSAGTVAAIDCCLQLVRDRHGADVAGDAAAPAGRAGAVHRAARAGTRQRDAPAGRTGMGQGTPVRAAVGRCPREGRAHEPAHFHPPLPRGHGHHGYAVA